LHFYFAYGSNLNQRQMAKRCPDFRTVSPAMAFGYRLVFPRPDSQWQGGVAGIVADHEAHIEGAVYKLSDRDLQALDDYEGVADGEYTRTKIQVALRDGDNIEAITYLANPEPDGPFTPSWRYLHTIIKGARQHGLSPPWIQYLRHLGDPIDVRPWGFWATLGWTMACAAITVGIAIVFTLITMLLIDTLLPTHPFFAAEKAAKALQPYMAPLNCITYLAAAAACISLLVFLAHWRTHNALGYLNLRQFRLRHLVLSAIALAGVATGEIFIAKVLDRPVDDDVIAIFANPRWAPLVFLMLVVAAPLLEEIVFRGFMFRGIAHSPARPAGAVIITSLIFALSHFYYPAHEIFVVFLIGIFLGVIRHMTGSTLITIILHAVGNLVAFTMLAVEYY